MVKKILLFFLIVQSGFCLDLNLDHSIDGKLILSDQKQYSDKIDQEKKLSRSSLFSDDTLSVSVGYEKNSIGITKFDTETYSASVEESLSVWSPFIALNWKAVTSSQTVNTFYINVSQRNYTKSDFDLEFSQNNTRLFLVGTDMSYFFTDFLNFYIGASLTQEHMFVLSNELIELMVLTIPTIKAGLNLRAATLHNSYVDLLFNIKYHIGKETGEISQSSAFGYEIASRYTLSNLKSISFFGETGLSKSSFEVTGNDFESKQSTNNLKFLLGCEVIL